MAVLFDNRRYARSGLELMLPPSYSNYGMSGFVDAEIW